MSLEATTTKVQELVAANGAGFDSSIKFVFNEGIIHLGMKQK